MVGGWGGSAGDGEESLDVLDKAHDVERFGPERHAIEFLQVADLIGVVVSSQDDRTLLRHLHVINQTTEPAAIHFAGFGDDHIGEWPGAGQKPDDVDWVEHHLGASAALGQHYVGQYFVTIAFKSLAQSGDGAVVFVKNEDARHGR